MIFTGQHAMWMNASELLSDGFIIASLYHCPIENIEIFLLTFSSSYFGGFLLWLPYYGMRK